MVNENRTHESFAGCRLTRDGANNPSLAQVNYFLPGKWNKPISPLHVLHQLFSTLPKQFYKEVLTSCHASAINHIRRVISSNPSTYNIFTWGPNIYGRTPIAERGFGVSNGCRAHGNCFFDTSWGVVICVVVVVARGDDTMNTSTNELRRTSAILQARV
jgi:hypothetical protein